MWLPVIYNKQTYDLNNTDASIILMMLYNTVVFITRIDFEFLC